MNHKQHNQQLADNFLQTQSKSYNQYKTALKHFINYIGERDLLTLSPDDIVGFVLEHKSNISCINTFLKWVYMQNDVMINLPMIQYLLPSDCKNLIKY
jgi:hypothetical protein